MSDAPPSAATTRPRPSVGVLAACVAWAVAFGLASLLAGSNPVLYQLAVWVPILVLLAPLLGRVEAAWRFIGGGVVLFTLGDVAWDVIGSLGQDPLASWPDAIYLSGYVSLAVGVALLLRDHGGPDRRNGLLDGVILAVPTVVVVVQFLVAPGDDATQPMAVRVVTALYPLADVLLVAGLVWLFVTPSLSRRVVAVLAAGMIGTLAVDVLWAVASQRGNPGLESAADALFPLTYVLLAGGAALGATSPLRATPATDDEQLPWGRVALLAAGLVAAPLAAVLTTIDEVAVKPVLVVSATLVAAGLVVLRFVGLVHRLNRTTQQLTTARNEIEELAVRDPLTGVFNRLVLPQQLAVLTSGSGSGAALLSIDLDRFKQVNDRHGHHAGDLVLEAVAERLVATTRRRDAVIRMGGDEFLLVLWDVTEAEALELATRLVTAIEQPVDCEGEWVRVSASVGIAMVGGDSPAADTEELLQAADQAMYRAKRRGAGRVQLTTA